MLVHTLVEITTAERASAGTLPDALAREKCTWSADGKTLSLKTESPAVAIVELVKWVEAYNLKLLDIQMRRPTLEDVFIELTGKKLRD